MGWREMRAFRMRGDEDMHFESKEEAYECGYKHGYKEAMEETYHQRGGESGMGYRHGMGYRDEMDSMGERRGYRIYQDDDDDFGERRRRRANGRFY